MLAGTSILELEDFVGAKYYCPNALADGNQHTRIVEKMLEFSSSVLPTLSLYLIVKWDWRVINSHWMDMENMIVSHLNA